MREGETLAMTVRERPHSIHSTILVSLFVRLHADVKQLVPVELVQTFFEFAVRYVRVRDRLRRRRRVVIHAHRTTNLERRVQLQALSEIIRHYDWRLQFARAVRGDERRLHGTRQRRRQDGNRTLSRPNLAEHTVLSE